MSRSRHLPAPHVVLGGLCLGLSASLILRTTATALAASAFGVAAAAFAVRGAARVLALAVVFALAGVWWGSARLDMLERSVLVERAGHAGPARVEVTGPARTGSFSVRVPVRVREFGRRVIDERARLELPKGRAPPQGDVLEVIASIRLPRRADAPGEFDELTYLRRQGVHVVLRAESYRVVGRRGGIAGFADRLRRSVATSLATGLDGERRAVVAGVVLGEDEGLGEDLQDDFRASGLYHLLAVEERGRRIAQQLSRSEEWVLSRSTTRAC